MLGKSHIFPFSPTRLINSIIHEHSRKILYFYSFLSCSVPNSRFFTTLYPKPIVLSAGTSFSLPITFRPLEKDVYEDRIEFHTKVRTSWKYGKCFKILL